MSNDPERMSNDPERMSNDPERMSNECQMKIRDPELSKNDLLILLASQISIKLL